jgi:pimeloyl-ACP methyl ester carboxylesterase
MKAEPNSQASESQSGEDKDPVTQTDLAGPAGRRLAVRFRSPDSGVPSAPVFVWFGGLHSDMIGTKARALDRWCGERGFGCLRFDYSGHGASSGAFEDGTITDWMEDACAALCLLPKNRPAIFVGSSMGAWMALLAIKAGHVPKALILIAPAPDFTDKLIWPEMDAAARADLRQNGVWLRSSRYDPRPYPVTERLITSGLGHLVLDFDINCGFPVRVIHGTADLDVPLSHGQLVFERLTGPDVKMTLVKGGDHRLSTPADIAFLLATCRELADQMNG